MRQRRIDGEYFKIGVGKVMINSRNFWEKIEKDINKELNKIKDLPETRSKGKENFA